MTGVQLISEGLGPLLFAGLIHVLWTAGLNPGLAYGLGTLVAALGSVAVFALPHETSATHRTVVPE
jgi:hypothetical protein